MGKIAIEERRDVDRTGRMEKKASGERDGGDSKGKDRKGQKQIVSQPRNSVPEALLASASLIFLQTSRLLIPQYLAARM